MEKVMQYVWQWRLYGSPERRLTDGRAVRIIHPGTINTSSGPDFFNAKLKLDGAEWAGNVELHVQASDWRRHGHHLDRAYDSVILHVVGKNDTYVRRSDGTLIPQLLLPFNKEIAERYSVLASDVRPLRCRAFIADVPRIYLHDAVDAGAMERLLQKSDRVHEYLKFTRGDWVHTCFIALARALGAGVNSEPFERLARGLSPLVAGRHADSVFQLEALTLGYAGLLDAAGSRDEYARRLTAEWDFLSHKYDLQALPAHVWKTSASRPAASPLRKLVYLAHILAQGNRLLSQLLEAGSDVEKLRSILTVKYTGYWADRLTFGDSTGRNYSSAPGQSQLNGLMINAVAPLLYAYGELAGTCSHIESAQKLLHTLPAETNSVMRLWQKCVDISPANAWESQGLLQLTRAYCEPGNCLRCRIALQAMRRPLMSASDSRQAPEN